MLHEAGNLSDLPPGSIISVKINKLELLIANLNGSIYAVDNRCPHMGGDLSKGKLEGHIVTCPLHGSQFDVTTGALVRWLKGSGLIATIGKVIKSPSSLRTYPVVLDGNRIMVDIIEPEEQARVPDLPAAEIKTLLEVQDAEKPILLDVRSRQEYKDKHLPDALLIPLDELAYRRTELDSSKQIIIYCRTGNKSSQAAKQLAKLGYKKIMTLSGGISNWPYNTISSDN